MGDSGEHVGEQSVILFFSFIIYQLIGNPCLTFNLLLWLCMRIVDGHRRMGSKICGGSPFNSKSHGNSSPTEIPSIRGLQKALESLKEL